MHSSLMSSVGVRPETRDNMGHSTVDVTQNVCNKTWWEERVEDAVVLDIHMPGMSGIDAAQELRRLGSSAKIIFLTIEKDPE
jgi:CheY-like chemotaxis protein